MKQEEIATNEEHPAYEGVLPLASWLSHRHQYICW